MKVIETRLLFLVSATATALMIYARANAAVAVGGGQYVAVAAGGNFQSNYPLGDAIAIFKLPATAASPAP